MRAKLGLAGGDIPGELGAFSPALMHSWQVAGVTTLALAFGGRHSEVAEQGAAVRDGLSAHGIDVSQYSGVNANFVHHSSDVRKHARESALRAIPAAAALGCGMVVSGCGTNRDGAHFYAPDARNYSAEAEDRLITELRIIAPAYESAGMYYAIECHQLSTMRAPAVIRRVLDAVDSPSVVANFDPVNLLDSSYAVHNSSQAIPAMVDQVGPRYGPTCHVKDARVELDLVCRIVEVPPGDGLVDLRAVFAAAERLSRGEPVPLIVEHLTAEQSPDGLRVVRELGQQAGITWV